MAGNIVREDVTIGGAGVDWARSALSIAPTGQVAIGAGKVLVAAGLLSLAPDLTVVVIALLTVAIYGHNDLTDQVEDGVNDPAQAAALADRRRWLASIVGAAGVGALVVAATGGLMVVLLALVPAAVGVCYNARILPGPGPDRLKELLVVNTVATAAAWAVPVVLLPVAFAGAVLGPLALAATGFLFVRTYAASEFANVGDAVGDAAAGVATLPVVLGERATRWLLVGIDALSAGLVLLAVPAGVVPASTALALLPGIAISAVVLQPHVDLVPTARQPEVRDVEFGVSAVALLLL